MNTRSHEEFCAELARRRAKLIKQKKMRQRILLSCIPFVVCLGLIVTAGMQGRLQPEVETEGFDPAEKSGDASLLKITLPVAWNGLESAKSETELEIKNAEDAEKLLAFIETYEEAFLFSSGTDGWYVCEQSDSSGNPSAAESFGQLDTSDTTDRLPVIAENAESETETEWIVEETTEAFSEDLSPEDPSSDGAATEGSSETDLSGEHDENTANERVENLETEIADQKPTGLSTGSSFQEELADATDSTSVSTAESVKIYRFSSTELTHSVENIDLVYIISITTEDGKTVRYALDAVKYAELAEQLNMLLKELSN